MKSAFSVTISIGLFIAMSQSTAIGAEHKNSIGMNFVRIESGSFMMGL
jgi:hypothetical protein